MNGSLGRMTAQGEERVTFTADASHTDRFVPQVAGSTGSNHRPFDGDDMGRVMDFEGLSEAAPVTDGSLRFCSGQDSLTFSSFYFCLRAGFLFYFDTTDIDDNAGPYTTYHNPPVGVVPLAETVVEYPPGGRRVFREHAQTDARTGYEMALLHVPPKGDNTPIRPPVFLVAEKLGNREKWKLAIQARAAVAKPTFLRAGYTKTAATRKSTLESPDVDGEEDNDNNDNNPFAATTTTAAVAAPVQKASYLQPPLPPPPPPSPSRAATTSVRAEDSSRRNNNSSSTTTTATTKKRSSNLKQRAPGGKSIEQQVLDVSNDEELAGAVVEFGVANFNENEWMNRFFQIHNDFDAARKCREMENFQMDMKKSLKGAVLEQYEYFVEASGEMTTMGREVSALKNYIETQVETVKEMKEIDFAAGAAASTAAAKDLPDGGRDEIMGRDSDAEPAAAEMALLTEASPRTRGTSRRKGGGGDAGSGTTFSETSGSEFRSSQGGAASHAPIFEAHDDDEFAPPIDIPDWLEDTQEEIAAFIRECRYNDAIEIQIKARNEIQDLFDKHERPTAYRLQKAQVLQLRTMLQTLDTLGKRISTRLEETLRRKNEALKQSSKRERSDPNAANMSLISPCALNDDALYLQLLVKLGRTQQAAEAYSARRSLLLLETLHERPISGSGSVDLVIYAAQLSQSFFSCLADSVEGFLDLFMASDNPSGGGVGQHHHHDHHQNGGSHHKQHEEMSLGDSSSIHSQHASKSAAAGSAMSSVVLWCDAELFKFAAAFGGTRILANLALSPPTRANQRGSGPLSRMQQQNAEPSQPRVVGQDDVGKERRNAIEVAAQCLDQAFQYASSNLDSVGLPLTPRLAEYLRARLKGCEAEVSSLLDQRWQILTADWRMDNTGAVVGAVANNMLSNGTAF
jgi:hypothetical protein